MRIGGIYKPNALIGHYLVGDGFFRSHFNNPLPVAVLLKKGGSAAVTSEVGRALGSYPNVKVQTRAEFEQTQQPRSTSCSAWSTPCWPGGDHRPHRNREHPDAVGVRAHPRDRPAPGGRDEAAAGPRHDPLGIGDPGGLRRHHRDHRGHRSGGRPGRLAQATGHSPTPWCRSPAWWCSCSWPPCSAWPPPAGRPAGRPSSTCWPRSPPSSPDGHGTVRS